MRTNVTFAIDVSSQRAGSSRTLPEVSSNALEQAGLQDVQVQIFGGQQHTPSFVRETYCAGDAVVDAVTRLEQLGLQVERVRLGYENPAIVDRALKSAGYDLPLEYVPDSMGPVRFEVYRPGAALED